MKLTPHFTLEEMTFSQTAARKNIPNSPTPQIIENLKRLCWLLEDVRDSLARSISISSGYRSSELNKAIGGTGKSQHSYGCAADFTVNGLSANDTVKMIIEMDFPFDQLILEYNRWVHISVPSKEGDTPRKQALIIDSNGVRNYA